MTALAGLFCQDCGKAITKPYGVRLGFAYCQACYNRATDKTSCSECGEPVRHLRGCAPEPCHSCRAKGRVCLRCGRPAPARDATTVEGGVACKACAKYFKPPRPCPCCNQLSLRLSRDRKAGITIPVCDHCRTKGHVTCQVCRKYRRPAGQDDHGRVVCKRCLESGGAAFVCPKCGEEGIRHSASRCGACYWRDRLKDQAAATAAALKAGWVREAFVAFTQELAVKIGGPVALKRLQRYAVFFLKLELHFKRPEAIDDMALARVFGPDGLRKFATPFGFLVKAQILSSSSAETMGDAKELERQALILSRAEGAWYRPLLERYHQYQLGMHDLYQRRGWVGQKVRFIPRTITQNMRAAYRFLSTTTDNVLSEQGIDQSAFDRFCFHQPGYRNGIRGFVRYLNTKEKLFGRRKIKIETPQRSLPEGVFLSQEHFQALVDEWSNPPDDAVKESLICLIMLTYAQSVQKTVRIALADLMLVQGGGYAISFGKVEIRLHRTICRLLDQWLAQRSALATMEEAWSNQFLFPGRNYGGHLTAAAVTPYLKKRGLTAEQLFATSIFQAYLNGLKHPKVLVQAFGISKPSATKYMLDERLMAEVKKRFKPKPGADPSPDGTGEVVQFPLPAARKT